MPDEILSVMTRAESGFLYPQDQKVVWAALKSAAQANTSASEADVAKFLRQHIANGLNHTRQIKALREHAED